MKNSILLLSLGFAFACSGGAPSDDATGDGDANAGGTNSGGSSLGESGGASVGGIASASGGSGDTGGGSSGGTSATGGTGVGTGGLAQTPGGMAGAPPATWEEHWFEHEETLQLVDSNEWVVIYTDSYVPEEDIGWMLEYFTAVWQYTVTHYGQFTDGSRDGRVYMIFHQRPGWYSGGHPSTYFDASHDYRNVSDAGPGPWQDGSYDIPTHEIAHIVEGASRGHHASPSFGIWGDSKWAEFYLYDIYVALGKEAAAKRVYDDFTSKSDGGVFWFRDWFYPLWKDHGGVQVMVNYFQLLADEEVTSLNFGEFIHFMSGAAGTDLKQMATDAFGWPADRETEFQNAQAKYPNVTY